MVFNMLYLMLKHGYFKACTIFERMQFGTSPPRWNSPSYIRVSTLRGTVTIFNFFTKGQSSANMACIKLLISRGHQHEQMQERNKKQLKHRETNCQKSLPSPSLRTRLGGSPQETWVEHNSSHNWANPGLSGVSCSPLTIPGVNRQDNIYQIYHMLTKLNSYPLAPLFKKETCTLPGSSDHSATEPATTGSVPRFCGESSKSLRLRDSFTMALQNILKSSSWTADSKGLQQQPGNPNSWIVYKGKSIYRLMMVWWYPHFRKPPNGCCKCPNETSPTYWGYNLQQILENDVQNPQKGTFTNPCWTSQDIIFRLHGDHQRLIPIAQFQLGDAKRNHHVKDVALVICAIVTTCYMGYGHPISIEDALWYL